MGLSSRQFLITSSDALHRLTDADFDRLYKGRGAWRAQVLASQRVRWASLVVELFDRQPVRVVHRSLGFIQFDDIGRLDVEQLNREQVARVDAVITPVLAPRRNDTVIDASSRFAARGGIWKPDAELSARINAAALGRLHCLRIKLEA
jgi:hypothetical protein